MRSKSHVVPVTTVFLGLAGLATLALGQPEGKELEITPPAGYQMSTTLGKQFKPSSWHLTKNASSRKVGITISRLDNNLIYRLSRGLHPDDPLGGLRAAAQDEKRKNPAHMTINKDTVYTLHGFQVHGFDTHEVRPSAFVVKRWGTLAVRGHIYKVAAVFRFPSQQPDSLETSQLGKSKQEWESVFASIQ